MRWVGALEVVGLTQNMTPIWKDVDFPVRFEVHPLIILDAEQGIPMDELEGCVSFFSGSEDRGKYKGLVRGSPNEFRYKEDGDFILNLLRQAEQKPIIRPVDPKKLARKPYNLFKVEQFRGKVSVPVEVTVPEPEELNENVVKSYVDVENTEKYTTQHTEIQFMLLNLGIDMGLEVWVAKKIV